MGLGKEKGSSRINRYEHQVTAVGFDNLEKLAEILQVPAAYLLAETPEMADAILALSQLSQREQAKLVEALEIVAARADTADGLHVLIQAWLDAAKQ